MKTVLSYFKNTDNETFKWFEEQACNTEFLITYLSTTSICAIELPRDVKNVTLTLQGTCMCVCA
jgi:hypothetical protein